jgi:hypothetical protein
MIRVPHLGQCVIATGRWGFTDSELSDRDKEAKRLQKCHLPAVGNLQATGMLCLICLTRADYAGRGRIRLQAGTSKAFKGIRSALRYFPLRPTLKNIEPSGLSKASIPQCSQ